MNTEAPLEINRPTTALETNAKQPANEVPPTAGSSGPNEIQQAESNEIQHMKKKAFLAAFRETGTVTGAARAVGINPCTHYAWLKSDSVYAAAFEVAHEDAADFIESEAR